MRVTQLSRPAAEADSNNYEKPRKLREAVGASSARMANTAVPGGCVETPSLLGTRRETYVFDAGTPL